MTVELTRQAEKDLKDLTTLDEEATAEILRLEDEPGAGTRSSGSLRGARSLEFNLKGSGAYRAVYTILDADRVCLVFIVGPHVRIFMTKPIDDTTLSDEPESFNRLVSRAHFPQLAA